MATVKSTKTTTDDVNHGALKYYYTERQRAYSYS